MSSRELSWFPSREIERLAGVVTTAPVPVMSNAPLSFPVVSVMASPAHPKPLAPEGPRHSRQSSWIETFLRTLRNGERFLIALRPAVNVPNLFVASCCRYLGAIWQSGHNKLGMYFAKKFSGLTMNYWLDAPRKLNCVGLITMRGRDCGLERPAGPGFITSKRLVAGPILDRTRHIDTLRYCRWLLSRF